MLYAYENVTTSKCKIEFGNETWLNIRDITGCHFFPQINFYSPYKNLFCKHCNNQFGQPRVCNSSFYHVSATFSSKSLKFYPIFRNFFAYSENDDDLSQNKSPDCKSTQAYISKEVSLVLFICTA